MNWRSRLVLVCDAPPMANVPAGTKPFEFEPRLVTACQTPRLPLVPALGSIEV